LPEVSCHSFSYRRFEMHDSRASRKENSAVWKKNYFDHGSFLDSLGRKHRHLNQINFRAIFKWGMNVIKWRGLGLTFPRKNTRQLEGLAAGTESLTELFLVCLFLFYFRSLNSLKSMRSHQLAIFSALSVN
jgi:hypothetical protein